MVYQDPRKERRRNMKMFQPGFIILEFSFSFLSFLEYHIITELRQHRDNTLIIIQLQRLMKKSSWTGETTMLCECYGNRNDRCYAGSFHIHCWVCGHAATVITLLYKGCIMLSHDQQTAAVWLSHSTQTTVLSNIAGHKGDSLVIPFKATRCFPSCSCWKVSCEYE